MRAMPAPSELTFVANGIRFAGLHWAREGALPTLALHGWLDNAASFFALAPQLTCLNIVAIDLAGHGKSEHRPGAGAYSIWDDIQDVLAIADQLNWSRFHLLGHSRGAIISTLLASAFPERVLSAALIEGFLPEPALACDAPAQLAKAIHGLRNQQQKKSPIYPDFKSAVVARENGLFPVEHAAAKALAERGVVARAEGFAWNSDRRLLAPSPLLLTREQLNAFSNKLKMPIKLITASDGLPAMYRNYLDCVPCASTIEHDQLEGGHHLHMERQANLVAQSLNEFFSKQNFS